MTGMSLAAQIQTDLTAAMKARDAETTGTLRMVLAAIKNLRVSEGHSGEVTDEETIDLLSREAKKRVEAAAAYDGANRPELADKERAELVIIRRYLPEQLSEDEVHAIVDAVIAETGAAGAGDLGKVMAAVMPRVKGRADGKLVSTAVRERLGA
jgi:uncharacterized protein